MPTDRIRIDGFEQRPILRIPFLRLIVVFKSVLLLVFFIRVASIVLRPVAGVMFWHLVAVAGLKRPAEPQYIYQCLDELAVFTAVTPCRGTNTTPL